MWACVVDLLELGIIMCGIYYITQSSTSRAAIGHFLYEWPVVLLFARLHWLDSNSDYCITCMCKSHLHLVSFLFVPALYYTLRFFSIQLVVSSHFVLSDVIVDDIVGLCTCTCTYEGNGVLFNCFLLWYV